MQMFIDNEVACSEIISHDYNHLYTNDRRYLHILDILSIIRIGKTILFVSVAEQSYSTFLSLCLKLFFENIKGVIMLTNLDILCLCFALDGIGKSCMKHNEKTIVVRCICLLK